MWCGNGNMKFCPFTFGIALGLTCFLSMFICGIALLVYNVSPTTMPMMMPTPTSIGDAFLYSLWGLIKGFLFGFFFALIYDGILCCWKRKCPHGQGSNCSICCGPKDNNPMMK